MGMTCCSLPKLLGLSYAVVPDAVIITLFQIPGIICGSCQQTHDYSYYAASLTPEPFPHWTFTTKLRLMQGKQKKTTDYPMVSHIYCPFSFRSLFVFEGSRQRTFLGCIQKMGMGMQLQSFPYVAGFSSAWGQCHAVKVIICCSTQQRTGR